MDLKLLSGALGAEISGVDLKDSTEKNFRYKDILKCKHYPYLSTSPPYGVSPSSSVPR